MNANILNTQLFMMLSLSGLKGREREQFLEIFKIQVDESILP